MKRKAKGDYHHGALREAILAASLQSIREHGIAGLSLREAARRAGVSAAAPYFHFKNRQELLDAIGAEGFLQMGEAMQQALAAAGASAADAHERLMVLGQAYIRYALREPERFTVMFQACGLASPGVTWQLLVDSMAAVAALRGEPERAPALTLLAWSAVHGAATLLLHGGIRADGQTALPPEEVERMVTEALRDLLRAKPAPREPQRKRRPR